MKQASDLKPGDSVVTLDGQVHRIRLVSRGWRTDSVIIQWRNGWACVPKDTLVESPATNDNAPNPAHADPVPLG